MSQATITLPDGTTVRNIPCTSISITGKKSIDAKPNANLDGPVEAQTNAYENLKLTIQGVHYTGSSDLASTDLTWEDVVTLYKSKFTGSNAAKLNVTYGSSTQLVGLENSTDIYVVLESFTFPIDQRDSKQGYLPIGNLTFIETDLQ